MARPLCISSRAGRGPQGPRPQLQELAPPLRASSRNRLYNPPMTYKVMARKWRPRSFDTLVGQDHVVRALTHALDTQRLHHAWLFTGTRGAWRKPRCRASWPNQLNCETGIASRSLAACAARRCWKSMQGRFVDYLQELDAASRPRRREMTQLPGAGGLRAGALVASRSYMIRRSHAHADRARLQRHAQDAGRAAGARQVHAGHHRSAEDRCTVLSRCLQFNLKQMPADSIVGHLQAVAGSRRRGLRSAGPAAGSGRRPPAPCATRCR